MFVVDTNVLVYAANADDPAHEVCHDLLESWRRGSDAWYLTWGICYEFLRVSTHSRVLPRPLSSDAARSFLEALFASPSLGILVPTRRHAAVLDATVAEVPLLAGNLWHDAATATLMREHGIRRICTRDTDFHRFPWVEPLDPLTLPR